MRDAAAKRGVPLATILVSVAVVALTYLAGKLAYRIRDVLLMIAVAGFVCLILNPLVVALQRWGIRRRGWAVALVATWTVVVFIGLLAAFGYPLAHGVTHFSQRLPSYVQAAEHGHGWIGGLVTRFHLQAWVNRNAPKLQSLGTTLAKPALTAGKGAASLLATLATIFALIVLFLLEGPKMRQGLLQLMPPQRAACYTRVAREISQSATGYALGNLLTSLIAGVVIFVTLTLLGVPFPLLWALWVALVDFLPMIGGALAGIPTVLFALGHSLTAGIITAAAFLIYQQIENHVLNPVVMSRTAKSTRCSSCSHSWSGRRSATGWAASSAASWGPCWPSRPRAPCRSSPGNCGRPVHGRNSARRYREKGRPRWEPPRISVRRFKPNSPSTRSLTPRTSPSGT